MSNPAIKSTVSTALAATAKQSNGAASAGMRLVADKGRKAAEWAAANPGKTAALGAGAVLIAAPMAVAAPVLGVFGFGANGIVAGSVAAGAQSGIGSVVAPSLFATLQSAGAGGYGVATVSAAVQGGGAAVASSGIMSMFRKKKDQENKDENAEESEKERPLDEEADQERKDSDKDDDDDGNRAAKPNL